MSLTQNKFNYFSQDLAQGLHKLNTDQMTVALSDTLPVATNHVLADLTPISYTNLGSRNITTTSCLQTSGTTKFLLTNLLISATGNVAQWRYIVIYNSTATNGNLIGWFDYGSEVNMVSGDSLSVTFDGTNGLLTIA